MVFLLTIRYIYQYKDYLRNTRVNFAKNSEGVLEVTDTNNYYPFGLNHIGNSFLSGLGSYNAYKYNGKEVQGTGMYDFGARMYMPDLGRWGVADAYAEAMRRYSPYNYAFNNPVNYIDPDGNAPYNPRDVYGEHSAFNDDFDPNSSLSSYNGMSGSLGMYFANDAGAGYVWGVNTKGEGEDPKKEKTGPSFWSKVGRFFSKIFGGKKKGYLDVGPAEEISEFTITNVSLYLYASYIHPTTSFIKPTNETFFSFSGGNNDPDKETLNKLRPGDNIDPNNMFEYIINGYGRAFKVMNVKPDHFQTAIDMTSLSSLPGGNGFYSPEGYGEQDTFSYYGPQAVGLNIYRGNGGIITGVGVKTQDIHLNGLSRSQRDSVISRVNGDDIKRTNQKDSVLRRIMKSR